MRHVCSYCQKTIRETPGTRVDEISHGMCPPCGEHFEKLWAGMKLGEYLDGLPGPVMLVDAEGRVLAANALAEKALGHDPASPRGLLGGEAMACAYSRLPGGCGKTVHCRDCTIRNAVMEVHRTGLGKRRVQAYLQTDAGQVPMLLNLKLVQGTVQVMIVGP